jgi:hypothetical protein
MNKAVHRKVKFPDNVAVNEYLWAVQNGKLWVMVSPKGALAQYLANRNMGADDERPYNNAP